MLVYIYDADLLCEECGEAIRADLTAKGKAPGGPLDPGGDPDDETTYDSDDFPKGPTEEGESDYPSHCGACGCFLESTLTDEGRAYVIATVKRDRAKGATSFPVSQLYGGPGQYSRPSEEWAVYYDDLDFGDEDEEEEDEEDDEEGYVECSICGAFHNDDNHTHQ